MNYIGNKLRGRYGDLEVIFTSYMLDQIPDIYNNIYRYIGFVEIGYGKFDY